MLTMTFLPFGRTGLTEVFEIAIVVGNGLGSREAIGFETDSVKEEWRNSELVQYTTS